MKNNKLLIFLFFCLLMMACEDKEDDKRKGDDDRPETQAWIEDKLSEVYLWRDEIKDKPKN